MVNVKVLGVYENLPMRALLLLNIDGEPEIAASILALPGKDWQLIMHAHGKLFHPTEEQAEEINEAVLAAVDSRCKVSKLYVA